jgi:hypothetical protein
VFLEQLLELFGAVSLDAKDDRVRLRHLVPPNLGWTGDAPAMD